VPVWFLSGFKTAVILVSFLGFLFCVTTSVILVAFWRQLCIHFGPTFPRGSLRENCLCGIAVLEDEVTHAGEAHTREPRDGRVGLLAALPRLLE